jgi:hypothetical protein
LLEGHFGLAPAAVEDHLALAAPEQTPSLDLLGVVKDQPIFDPTWLIDRILILRFPQQFLLVQASPPPDIQVQTLSKQVDTISITKKLSECNAISIWTVAIEDGDTGCEIWDPTVTVQKLESYLYYATSRSPLLNTGSEVRVMCCIGLVSL